MDKDLFWKNKVSFLGLAIALITYLALAFAGIRFGLPDEGHNLSYNCDELHYIEVLSHLKPAKLELNPYPFFTHPMGYLVMNAAATFIAMKVGWIPLGDKEFYRNHPDLWARYYLVGRFWQVICGVVVLFILWWMAKRLFNDDMATTAVLLASVTPSIIAASHFSQCNFPVAMFVLFALACLAVGASQNFTNKWLYRGAFLEGIALSMKLSALAFFMPLAYYIYKTKSWVRNSLISALLITVAFLLVVPFAVLSPRAFHQAMVYHVTANQMPLPNIIDSLLFSLKVAFPIALGWPLATLAYVSIAFALFERNKNPVMQVLLVWVFGFYIATVRVGLMATSARLLIALPTMILIASYFLDRIKSSGRIGKSAATLCFFVIYAFTARYSLAIIDARLRYPLQKQASDWIVENLPRGATIGLPYHIYWYTPDVVYKSFHHPEREAKPYKVEVIDYSIEKIKATKPEYVMMTGLERADCHRFGYSIDTCREFLNYFDGSSDYSLLKTFPRVIGFGGWTWYRPVRISNFDDDLWITPIAIYKRR